MNYITIGYLLSKGFNQNGADFWIEINGDANLYVNVKGKYQAWIDFGHGATSITRHEVEYEHQVEALLKAFGIED
jgi:hypothetical protein